MLEIISWHYLGSMTIMCKTKVFKTIMRTDDHEDIDDLQILDIDPLYNYFGDYYIGRFRSRNRRTIPTFPITF
jgi:hypothetical protein